ncbi:insulin-like growth factor-binding protein-related protein 1 [Centruroides sculpturatus]|uniref:insulin-like growth factor-binding protein-related protein 1 n=1 Tax=Centruroides sculpturatus TaxID=218467 RepID=UPI000C6EFBC0|nr:insulin-like growth factor-binding protein-related protein 1 [Centruroides sculpturatus]
MPGMKWVVWLFCLSAASVAVKRDCPPCKPQQCRPPENCLAGMVKDACDCCYVCARREGERCDNVSLPLPYTYKYGYCGENLECRLRTDLLPEDPAEATCECIKQEALCASDGQTYDNECQLTEARYKKRDGLRAMSRGPCRSVPKIISPPEDAFNKTGGSVALSCEVSGWPIPVIEWKVDHGNGITSTMPSDTPRISVQSRGGPRNYEVTSWLQVQRLRVQDYATYYCVARNDEGETSASARIYVTDIPRKTKLNEI